MIKVFNKITAVIETIDENNIDPTIHFHRNSHLPLKKNDFLVNTPKKELKVAETVKIEPISNDNEISDITIAELKDKLQKADIKFFA
jgi:hypothetical protein